MKILHQIDPNWKNPGDETTVTNWFNNVQNCTIQYSTLHTLKYNTVIHSTIQYSISAGDGASCTAPSGSSTTSPCRVLCRVVSCVKFLFLFGLNKHVRSKLDSLDGWSEAARPISDMYYLLSKITTYLSDAMLRCEGRVPLGGPPGNMLLLEARQAHIGVNYGIN